MPLQSAPKAVVLASGSPYKRSLLARICPQALCATPDVPEQRLPGESVDDMAGRLAREKARALAPAHPDSLLIGCDQAAECDGMLLGKPGDPDRQREQLAHCSGREVWFVTACAVLDAASGAIYEGADHTKVKFRRLSAGDIDRYIQREPAVDCAGGFKVEGLGIALFERVVSDDPTGLQGLPLILLSRLLRQAGYDLL